MRQREFMGEFILNKGNQVVQKIMIKPDDRIITIGRHHSNDVCLKDDPGVSRIHAAIIRYDTDEDHTEDSEKYSAGYSWFVRDLGSTYGTKVGSAYIHKKLLRDEDLIGISKYTILYRSTHGEADRVQGIPVNDRYGKLTPSKIYEQKTLVRSLYKNVNDRFSLEQQEFIGNMARGASLSFTDNPTTFMHHLLQVLKAQKGFVGVIEEDSTSIECQCGFDREDIHCSREFIETLRKRRQLIQEGALWLFLPENRFMGIFRIKPPAFEELDLSFMQFVCDRLVSSDEHADELHDLSPWPMSMIGLPEIKKRCLDVVMAELNDNRDILILGETGTGKEILARYIHDLQRNRSRSRDIIPFVSVNCGMLSKEFVHSELFGHVKGSFTGSSGDRSGAFRDSDGGILFLDEIGELPVNIQATLLTALQQRKIKPLGSDREHKVTLRVIAATDRDIEHGLNDESFRRALYERFPYKITLPPLRERKEDISLLAYYFLDKYSSKTRAFSREALEKLHAYDWPGNIRELQNTVKELVLLGKDAIYSWDLPNHIRYSDEVQKYQQTIQKTLKEAEKDRILEVLAETRGNKLKAHEILGITRTTLDNKIKKYGIPANCGKPKED